MEIKGNIFNILSIVLAVISGMLFAIVWRNYEQTVTRVQYNHNHYYGHLKDTNYNDWLKQNNLMSVRISEEFKSFKLNTDKSNIILESDYLYKKVPVLCLILCKSRKGARAVRLTWSKHCNNVIFFGPFADKSIPVIKYSPSSSHTSFCHSFIKTINKYINDPFQWMLIAYDETYAIVENLRHYVAPLNASVSYYLGRPIKQYAFKGIFNAPESGIVLSRGAVEIVNKVFYNDSACDTRFVDGIGALSRNFEISLAMILSHYGCHAVDTRDSLNRGRFHPFTPERHISKGMISIFNSYWRSSVFLSPEGSNCCSDYAITFNGIPPTVMHLTEYLLYHMAIFDNSPIGLGNKPPPYKVRSDFDNRLKEINMIEVGTPLVHYMEKNKGKSKTALTAKSAISRFLSDLFGS